jgi:beta-RFAP synthase
MIRVQAPSRLHFGLLSFPTARHWPGHSGQATLPARQFGSVGLMVQAPGVSLCAAPAATWSAGGPLAERALAHARQFAATFPAQGVRPQHLAVTASAPEHAGLGTGTQLGLAVARALAVASGLGQMSNVELAQRVGRGVRSALGIHGFDQGGFLVDAGKLADTAVAPLVAHLAFPDSWRLVLLLPSGETGLHGESERKAFQWLHERGMPLALTDTLCRLVLLGLLPALVERDLTTFGEALYDLNVRVGEAFAPIQGGPYATPQTAELVALLRRQGIRGVGQSSWGPTVFAVVGDEESAHDLASRVRNSFPLGAVQIIMTEACNRGATVATSGF